MTGGRLPPLQILHEPGVKFHCPGDGLQADLFVDTVDASPFLGGEGHGGEPIDPVTQIPVVPGIGALHHKIRGYDAAGPGLRHR